MYFLMGNLDRNITKSSQHYGLLINFEFFPTVFISASHALLTHFLKHNGIVNYSQIRLWTKDMSSCSDFVTNNYMNSEVSFYLSDVIFLIFKIKEQEQIISSVFFPSLIVWFDVCPLPKNVAICNLASL